MISKRTLRSSGKCMRGHCAPLLPQDNRRAVALVIVLAFIVLVTGLVLAFFSRAMLDRQISNSSASQVKCTIFAQGAMDQIVGDLKQEIVDSSSSTGVNIVVTGTFATPLYYPLSNASMTRTALETTAAQMS